MRGRVVTALLVLAFGVAAALAIQAYRVAGDHRAQADRVLRDYAALAAARVAQLSAYQIYYYGIMPTLKELQRAHEMAPQEAVGAGDQNPHADRSDQVRAASRRAA